MGKHEFYYKSANNKYLNPGCVVVCDTGTILAKAQVSKITKNFIYLKVLVTLNEDIMEGRTIKRKNPKKMWVLEDASAD